MNKKINDISSKEVKAELRQYETLAMHATYDFKLEEGKDPRRLLCDIASNVDNIDKLQRKRLNSRMFTDAITEQLIKVIKSRRFQSSLNTYCREEIEEIKNIETYES